MDTPHEGTPPKIPGYDDGYCGGSETPSDSLDLDPMLFPERIDPNANIVPWNMGESYEAFEERRIAAVGAQERQEYFQKRSFTLSPDVAMGANLAPPRKV